MLQAAGGEVCPAVVLVANIPSWASPGGTTFSAMDGTAICCPGLRGLGTELTQTWPFSAYSPAEHCTEEIKGFL